MTATVPEMPISEAREHLADLVNQAAYSGQSTYLTRRDKRVAIVMPVGAAEAAKAREMAEAAKAREDAIVEVSRAMWRAFDGDKAMQARLRDSIDTMVANAEDASDLAAVDAALAELAAGGATVPAEELHRELGL